jgi:hypothetical protein
LYNKGDIKKEIKLSLLADDRTVYIKHLKNSRKTQTKQNKNLELIHEFSQVTVDRVNIPKLNYISIHEQWMCKLKLETISL